MQNVKEHSGLIYKHLNPTDLQYSIVAQGIAIIGIFIAGSYLHHTLGQKAFEVVFDIALMSFVLKARSELIDNSDVFINFSKEKETAIGGCRWFWLP